MAEFNGKIYNHPLESYTIKTGPDTEAVGVSGAISVSLKDGASIYFTIHETSVSALFENRQAAEVEQFFEELAEYLRANPIYRGKAITTYRKFIDLPNISPGKVVYSDKVWKELNEHVWSLIRKPDECERVGVNLPRKILFQGLFGSGKTLAANITAKIAIENGWTAIVMPTSGPQASLALPAAVLFAGRNSPALLIIEDIELEQRDDNAYVLKNMLDAFDGLVTKWMKIMIIITTNYPDKITAAMNRPGRIDKVIKFGELDPENLKRLVLRVAGEDKFSPDISWASVVSACKDYTPAFVEGVSKNAALEYISADAKFITEKMLVDAANDLREQFENCRKGFGAYL